MAAEVSRFSRTHDYFFKLEDPRPYEKTGNVDQMRNWTPFMNDLFHWAHTPGVGLVTGIISVALSPVIFASGIAGMVLSVTAAPICWGVEKGVRWICSNKENTLIAPCEFLRNSFLTTLYGIVLLVIGIFGCISLGFSGKIAISNEKDSLRKECCGRDMTQFLQDLIHEKRQVMAYLEQQIEKEMHLSETLRMLRKKDFNISSQMINFAPASEKDGLLELKRELLEYKEHSEDVEAFCNEKDDALRKSVSENGYLLRKARLSVKAAEEMLKEPGFQQQPSAVRV